MNAPITHPFDQAVALEPTPDGRLRGHTSELYWNMISPFGGATAATVLHGILGRPERHGDPVALTVNFVAPIAAGEFFVETKLMRSNRSTQHWSVQIVQGAERALMVSAIAFLGVRRPTWSLTEAVRPEVKPRDAYPRIEGRLKLPWMSMYDMRYPRGQIPNPHDDSLTYSWTSDAPPRPLDFFSLTAFCDMFMPRIFLRRPMLVPIGTVSLNIYYHANAVEMAAQGTEPVFGVAQGQICHNGYFDQQGQLWGTGDKLLATTQQIVWYKE